MSKTNTQDYMARTKYEVKTVSFRQCFEVCSVSYSLLHPCQHHICAKKQL